MEITTPERTVVEVDVGLSTTESSSQKNREQLQSATTNIASLSSCYVEQEWGLNLGEGVGKVAGASGSTGVGVSVLLPQIGWVDAAHVDSPPVLLRVQCCVQLSSGAPIYGDPKPSHPDRTKQYERFLPFHCFSEKVVCNLLYLASDSTSRPPNDLRFWRRSMSRILVSALCSQQSAMIPVTLPFSSTSSYALMKWNVRNGGTSTLAT
ncbi:hypothetical protein BHM03_00023659 [Ensete ventricosum]|uniref:Uncharacterized protein n=1 Tax=Ensete ventricosum TaxID=4639 RepID=A0A445MGP1_ENSVE|nr:hypothetical protein BHM03_00023659 [Ensete ventricosum]